MSYEARYVFRPQPGADLDAVVQAMARGAELWCRHGAPKPRLWTVTAGELGEHVLAVEFENAAAHAKTVDALSADPDFHRWQVDNLRGGGIAWLRSTLAREIPL